jgi:mevalonate kinase
MSSASDRSIGSAGGKVILLGEHAVVHGAPALATGVPLEVRVEAAPLDGPARVRIEPWGLAASVGDPTPVGRALAALLRELGLEMIGVSLSGESRIPPRAGLGSSAALATAIVRALAGFCDIGIDDQRQFGAVQASERVFHGDPSGLDAAVAIHGGVLRFDRAHGAEPVDAKPPPIVVAHSGTQGRTAETVARFANRLADRAAEGRRRLTRLAQLAEIGVEAIVDDRLAALGDAMNACHEQLDWFGVSTDELNRICDIARAAGALGAKLTGGGGGGCAVALVEPGDADAVADAIAAAGFEVVLR